MTTDPDQLIDRARAWIAGDPDPVTRAELREILERRDHDRLVELVDGAIEFGTAGLRGIVGPGPRQMNRAVVIRTTRGLADHIRSQTDQPLVVVGRDARTMSEDFARDTVAVLAAAGATVRWFRDPVPTPLVAFAAKHLAATAAVVITASHNPPAYNGYKVYAANAAQIIPPEDAEIAAAIAAVGPADQVPRTDAPYHHELVSPVPDQVVEDYLDRVEVLRRPAGHTVRIVHTPLHGVAGPLVEEALARAGHGDVHVVVEQAEADPAFPTLPFPNPEEPGALDLATAAARDLDADLVLANDPDGDRLAVEIPSGDGWRMLSGNQVGALFAAELLERPATRRRLVVSSIVSSPMVAAIAEHHGACYEATLTGFKWICNAALALEAEEGLEFAFGYEEALGYTVGDLVRDKDGISAAVVFADLAASLRATGRTVADRLEELYRAHGLWVSVQRSVTLEGVEGQERIDGAMRAIGERQPGNLAGRPVVGVTDFRVGAEARPWWLPAAPLVRLELQGGSRVLVRPSGTEPKLKVYADLVAELADGVDASNAEAALRDEADAVAQALVDYLGLG